MWSNLLAYHPSNVKSRHGDSSESVQARSSQSSAGQEQGREIYVNEQTRRENAAKLLRLLERNDNFALDCDDVSLKSAFESLGDCSDTTPSTGNRRRGLLGLLKSRANGGGSVERISKSTRQSSTSTRSKSHRTNLQDFRAGQRRESRQRQFVRLADRMCCTIAGRSEADIESNGGDCRKPLLDFSDSTETEDSITSFLVEKYESEGGPSKSAEGCCEEIFEVQEMRKKPLPPKACSEEFTLPTTSPYRRSTNMMSGGASNKRPTLRRAMSTPTLQTHQPELRSILKKGDALSSTQPRVRNDASVRFDSVLLREFHRTVGDNPSVSCGVPMALDWNYNPEPMVHDLDDYESNRLSQRRPKRDLALGPARRAHLLHREWGIPMRTLHETVAETDEIRNQRLQSATQKSIQYKRDEIFETAKRRVGRAFTGGKKKEMELLRDLGVRDVVLKSNTVDPPGLCMPGDI